MSRKSIILGAVVLVIAAALSWQFMQRRAAAKSTPQATSENEVSALVRTQALRKANLPTELIVYGDIATGKVEGVSFARAGQVSRLLVVQGQRVRRGGHLVSHATAPYA